MAFGITTKADLTNLAEGDRLSSFSVVNLWVDEVNEPVGARFIDLRYGFIVDLLSIQSVPQGFFWVKTPPKWDKGEPHTCEHLVLGKGNRGRDVAALEQMTLGHSSAFTAQLLTAYHFNATTGKDSFYELFEAKLTALLHPDFTNEEIRREVCHVGVVENENGNLSLDEKGTVYTEMVSSYEKPWAYLYNTMEDMLYGDTHPLANSSGGAPKAIRTMVPEDLWEFHRDFYQLSNMGIIVSIPPDIPISECLDTLSEILQKSSGESREKPERINLDKIQSFGIGKVDLPEPQQGQSKGTVKIVDFPNENPHAPGQILYGWAPELDLDLVEIMLFELFLGSFTQGSTSILYDVFQNSETKTVDFDVTFISGSVSDQIGNPIYFSIGMTDNSNVNPDMIEDVKDIILNEILKVSEWEDGSEELMRFSEDALSRLEGRKKRYSSILDSPPMFGFRRGGAGRWLHPLRDVEKQEGFRKSIARKQLVEAVEKLLTSGKNIWKEEIHKWKILTSEPYKVGVKPNPELIQQTSDEKEARLKGYIEEFKQRYSVASDQEAIAAYKVEFDKMTKELEALSSQQVLPKFVDNPPLTPDDQLDYEVLKIGDDIPLVWSKFDHMTSATFGVAFRLSVIPEADLLYIPLLPSVLTGIGVVKDGEIVKSGEMQKRLRKEVRSLNAYFESNMETGRIELILKGAGVNPYEFLNAIDWMESSLHSPLLTEDNLLRMLDIIDQTLVRMRNVMKRGEESWVDVPPNAFRMQRNPLFLTTDCFMTQTHQLQRLRWRLTDPGDKKNRKQLKKSLNSLCMAGEDQDRNGLVRLLDSKSTDNTPGGLADLVNRIATELKITLADIPDANLQEDWKYLCKEIELDIMVDPEEALAGIENVLVGLRQSENARMFMISSSETFEKTQDRIRSFGNRLVDPLNVERVIYSREPRITDRLKSRVEGDFTPTYIGLINENTRNGVLHLSARLATSYDSSREAILNGLAGHIMSGTAAHGLFMKTWASGLAYSNGFRFRDYTGQVRYYAERCPDIAETMRFVVSEVKKGVDNPLLTEYVVSQCFSYNRAPDRYENRGEEMASNLADGITPEVVANYRRKVLEVRCEDGLWDEIRSRMESVYGKGLIGYGANMADVAESNYFIIGPETQFESLEKYIAEVEYPQPVYRLYPRDFWLVK